MKTSTLTIVFLCLVAVIHGHLGAGHNYKQCVINWRNRVLYDLSSTPRVLSSVEIRQIQDYISRVKPKGDGAVKGLYFCSKGKGRQEMLIEL
ncbi:hypothetical protein QR680_003939 [Steinernema hermaphroditum]|uniref:Uncharacterized protein n=1 Tax=Steinernema hermaphroditum TaxID=289476 RepID=A0AA39HM52_9BILA|nr:hypothetical protein QR680_003939 [Steinernema hermaphroditum]